MNKIIYLLLFVVALIQNSYGFYGNFPDEISQSIKDVLAKWEAKELNLDDGCAEQLYQVLENLLSFDDGFWAYKMIDATGKFPAGLAEGEVVVMGNFHECLDVKSEMKNITGNYCSVTADISGTDLASENQIEARSLTSHKKLTQMRGADLGGQPVANLPLYGICLPNKCSANDVRNALTLLSTFSPLDIRCQTKDDLSPPLDAGAIATITLFGTVAILMVFSTLVDYISQARGNKAHPILISFSVYTNGQNLFRMRSGQGELSSIHGIRFLSMCWVIIGHVYIANMLGPTVNSSEMLEYSEKTDSMFFVNCAHAVDTFFVLSGLLVSYNFMKKMKKGEKFNIFKYYIHRYLRLTPAYAVVILCSSYLLKYLGSGPLYYKIDTVVSQLCRDHWWQGLIYLQNYLTEAADICVSQSWNLNIDYQLYLISPILLFFLYKTPRFGTILTLLPIIGCMAAGYVITYKKHLAVVLVSGDTTKFMTYYYLKTHTRAATWFIGAWLGYVLGRIKFYNDKTHLKIPKILIFLIWLAVLALIPLCIFGFHDVVKNEDDYVGRALYNAFVRPTWALCISWIIFACTLGYGGIINDFLSLPIFGLLSKFTYSIYLLHLTLLYMMVESRKIPAYFSVAGLANQFCTLFAFSFVLAIFWILAFEMPILVIEPYIFGDRKTPTRNQQNADSSGDADTFKNEVHLKVTNKISPSGPTIEIRQ